MCIRDRHRGGRPARPPAGRRALGLGARARQHLARGGQRADLERHGRRREPPRHGTGHRPRRRLLAAGLPATSGTEHPVPRVRGAKFETGRLAGLGLDPGGSPHATFSAWASYTDKPAGATLPYYHRWYFRTGDQGDFEYLVRLLEPRPMDARVGVRDVDTRDPGSNIGGVTHLDGILKLGGALRVPWSALSADELATAQ